MTSIATSRERDAMIVHKEEDNRKDDNPLKRGTGKENNHQTATTTTTTMSFLPLALPAGSEDIIKSLAAEQILMDVLNHFGDCSQVDYHQALVLVQQFPSICHRSYEFDWYQGQTRLLTPLAVLCCLKAPLYLIKAVHQRHPQAISIAEPTTTAIPLDYACSYEAKLEVVQFLLEQHPTAIQHARHERLLPLHLACHFSAPLPVVRCLIEAYPAAVENCESEGWYALHAAAAGRASLDVVQYLYEARPESASAQDVGDSTPLHIACTNGASLEVIQFLMQQAPDTLAVADVDSLTPLFRAARNQSAAVVEAMINFEVQQNMVDALGGTLLHHAAGHTQDEQVVAFLCHQFPHMLLARTTDPDQFLPLHIACLFGSSLNTVRILVDKCGESVTTRDGHGRLASALASNSRVYSFLKEQEQQGQKRKIRNETHASYRMRSA